VTEEEKDGRSKRDERGKKGRKEGEEQKETMRKKKQNRSHRNFESPSVQHYNAEKPYHQGDNKKYEREQVHVIL